MKQHHSFVEWCCFFCCTIAEPRYSAAMNKQFTARIPQNQMKIQRLMNELMYAQRCGDAFGIRFHRADLIAAKRRDAQGQMA